VLASVELDIDYPHDRLLWRCSDPEACRTRPQLDGIANRQRFLECLAAGLPPVTKGER
jgi:hypothetical protein